MVTVVKLYNMKATTIDIEMDISCFKIWRYGFPDFNFRMEFLDCAPCCIPDAFAMHFGRYKQQVEISVLSIYLDNYATDRSPFLHDPISHATIDGLPDRIT